MMRLLRRSKLLKTTGAVLVCLCVLFITMTPSPETEQHNVEENLLTDLDIRGRHATVRTGRTPVQTLPSVLDRLAARVNRTESLCSHKWASRLGPFLKSWIFFDGQPPKMAQCYVAKAGSTYWGRIFSFLTRPEIMKSLHFRSPFEIDRVSLHHRSGVRGKAINGNHSHWLDGYGVLRNLFVRDPYRRLWSGYLDKYYLPGYWKFKPLDAHVGLCQTNVSFQTFLEFAVTSDDDHVVPISAACNPCVFRPDVIGKMETFGVDTEYILQETKYSYLLRDESQDSFVEREIKTITSYNFQTRQNYKRCLSEFSLAGRLWQVFQFNGYIRSDRPFQGLMSRRYNVHKVTQRVIAETKSNTMSISESKRQKHGYLVDAYRHIPPRVIASIQQRFEADFELFNYDKNPPS